MFVPRGALVDTLILFGLHSADVHLQGPRVGPHGHIGVLIYVKVSPVSCPGETDSQNPQRFHKLCYSNVVTDRDYTDV